MLALLRRFELLIAWVLTVLLASVILLATIDLTVDLIKNVIYVAPHYLIGTDQLLELFGLFLIVLLGLELLETVKAYLHDDHIRPEVVLIVALIALARKVIIMEFKEPSPLTLLGVATLIISLAASYRLIMQVLRSSGSSASEKGK